MSNDAGNESSARDFRVGQYQLPPLRSVDEFILDKARFELPNFSDLSRWNNRIFSNFLYFQTNYFALLAISFVISTIFWSRDIAIGACAVSAVGGAAFFSLSSHAACVEKRREHPMITLGILVAVFLFLLNVLNAVLVLTACLAVPLFFIFVHASLRLRNFRAKINQQAERFGLQQSPMGAFLEAVGVDVKVV